MRRGNQTVNKRNLFLISCVALSLIFTSGCVKRNIHIASDPPGATVYFNEVSVGETPLDYDFLWYATHRLEVKKEGYEPVDELVKIKAPLFGRVPFDFFFELFPRDFWDKRELYYTLTPKEQ